MEPGRVELQIRGTTGNTKKTTAWWPQQTNNNNNNDNYKSYGKHITKEQRERSSPSIHTLIINGFNSLNK